MVVNKERVQKLVDALRSGEYEQGRGGLRRDESYCCLGVACAIFQQEKPRSEWFLQEDEENFRFRATPEEDFPDDLFLPPLVAEWYGFTNRNPILISGFSENRPHRQATLLNDGESSKGVAPRSFSELADLFEERFIKEDHDG